MSIKKIDQAIRDSLRDRQLLVGEHLIKDNQSRSSLTDAFVAFTCYLTVLNSKENYSHLDAIADSKSILAHYTEENIFNFTSMCKDMEAVRLSLAHDGFHGPPTQFAYLRAELRDFWAWNGFSTFFLKIELRRPDLKQPMYEKYIAAERSASYQSSRLNTRIVREMRDIITEWFGQIDLTDLLPKHGGGAVSNVHLQTTADKYLWMKKCWIPNEGWCWSEYMPHGFYLSRRSASDYTSRLIFVPKSYKALRTVKPEPVELMYWQQAIMKKVYAYVHKNRFLREHFPFHDQSEHHKLIRIGSINHCYGTIDLSQASDSVSYALVNYLFADTPLGVWLNSTRSCFFRYGLGERTYSYIFAGMGSALCFPIESIVFGSVCEAVSRRYGRYVAGIRWNKLSKTWSVYGDDIVIADNLFEAVSLTLKYLHFHVNDDKSFHDSDYLESCGREYYKGHDVTPLKYKVKYSEGPAATLAGLVALGNRALAEYSATTLYRWCRFKANDTVDHINAKRARKHWSPYAYVGTHAFTPKVADDSLFLPDERDCDRSLQLMDIVAGGCPDLAVKWRTRQHIRDLGIDQSNKIRWSKDHQCWEQRCLVISNTPRMKVERGMGYLETIALHETLRSANQCDDDFVCDKYSTLSGTKVQLRNHWTFIG
jgi:hypothetical protein